eukprot:TRINITY_DN1267_c0_g3_i1.p1 TRINITY_DN1267_c0_g3~~TRINITY_DN1267_c0_g3_i1.p1  ORF type:complete len:106 (-),score=31.95 TRINITY_DN1267_c0_g3_i1:88-405(-)
MGDRTQMFFAVWGIAFVAGVAFVVPCSFVLSAELDRPGKSDVGTVAYLSVFLAIGGLFVLFAIGVTWALVISWIIEKLKEKKKEKKTEKDKQMQVFQQPVAFQAA